MIAASD